MDVSMRMKLDPITEGKPLLIYIKSLWFTIGFFKSFVGASPDGIVECSWWVWGTEMKCLSLPEV